MIVFRILKIAFALILLVSFNENFLLFSKAGILNSISKNIGSVQNGQKREVDKEKIKMYRIMAEHIGPSETSLNFESNFPNYDVIDFEEKKIDSLKEMENTPFSVNDSNLMKETTSIFIYNRHINPRLNRKKPSVDRKGREVLFNEDVSFDPNLRDEDENSFEQTNFGESSKNVPTKDKNHQKNQIYDSMKDGYLHNQKSKNFKNSNSNKKPFVPNSIPKKTLTRKQKIKKPSKPKDKKIIEVINTTPILDNEGSIITEKEISFKTQPLLKYSEIMNETTNYSENFTTTEEITPSNVPIHLKNKNKLYTNHSFTAGPVMIKVSNDTSPSKLNIKLQPYPNTNLTLKIERKSLLGNNNTNLENNLIEIEKKDIGVKAINDKRLISEENIFQPNNENISDILHASEVRLNNSGDAIKLANELLQLNKDTTGRLKWNVKQNSDDSKFIQISNQFNKNDTVDDSGVFYIPDKNQQSRTEAKLNDCKWFIMNVFRNHTLAAVFVCIFVIIIVILFLILVYRLGQRSNYGYDRLHSQCPTKRDDKNVRTFGEKFKSIFFKNKTHIYASEGIYHENGKGSENLGNNKQNFILNTKTAESQKETQNSIENNFRNKKGVISTKNNEIKSEREVKTKQPVENSKNKVKSTMQRLICGLSTKPEKVKEKTNEQTLLASNSEERPIHAQPHETLNTSQRGHNQFSKNSASNTSIKDLKTKQVLDPNQIQRASKHNQFSPYKSDSSSTYDTEILSDSKTPSKKKPCVKKIRDMVRKRFALKPSNEDADGSTTENDGGIEQLIQPLKEKVKKKTNRHFNQKPVRVDGKLSLGTLVNNASFEEMLSSPERCQGLKNKIVKNEDNKTIDKMLIGDDWERSQYKGHGLATTSRERIKLNEMEPEKRRNINLEKITFQQADEMGTLRKTSSTNSLQKEVEKVMNSAENVIGCPQPITKYGFKEKNTESS